MLTTKIKSLEDLESIKRLYHEELATYKYQILVCDGAGCSPSQNSKLKISFKKLIEDNNLENEVLIIETGCMGVCALGPVLVIMPDGVLYTEVNSEKAAEIFQAHIIDGQVKEEFTFLDLEKDVYVPKIGEIDFISNQTRIVLRNCGLIDHSSIEAYIAHDGYAATAKALKSMSAKAVIEEVKRSTLRGRGHGNLPVGIDWEERMNARSGQKYIVCDADDGDSKTSLNRSILEGDPHSVLEGMILAGYGIGANKGYIYISPEYSLVHDCLSTAIKQARDYGLLGQNILESGFEFDLEINFGAGSFVCGEDSSLLASIEGKRGEAQEKNQFSLERRLFAKPTIVHNVETFANVPQIIFRGADWYTQYGTDNCKGTMALSLAGDIVNKGIIEVPMGISLGEVLYKFGGGIPDGKSLKAVQVGGPSGQLIPKGLLNTPMDYDSWEIFQTVMSSGELNVMSEDSCMVDTAKRSLEVIQDQSCGKCTPCRIGTQRLLEILDRITKGEGRTGDIELLEELSESIQLSSMCSFGENAANPVLSTIKYFRGEYEEHIRHKYCSAGACADLVGSPCENACPAGINVPGYMGLISEGKYIDAYHLIRRENPFPAVCGRICTRPCESKCRRAQLDEAIAIADLKRFVSDCAFELENPLREENLLPKKGKSIGIIGAGPSGLTCGYYLARLGYEVDVYEAHALAGGVLAFGIPEYRLPNDTLNREINLIEQAGVNIHLNTEIGKNIQFTELKNKHDAIYIATGSQIANKIDVTGENLSGVIHGLDFLRSVNLGRNVQVGDVVAVIGGGNTAIDAARTALRMGAQKVMLLYRRSIEDMPADIREIHEAIEEGIQIMPLVAPVRFIGSKDKIEEIECVRMELGLFDSGGRRRPKAQEGSNFSLKVDTVIPAVSQSSDLPFVRDNEVGTTQWGTLLTDKDNQMTTLEGVFAGGDVARGPDVAIHAIADGKKAAVSIDLFLGGKGILNKGEAIEFPVANDEDALHEHERYEIEILAPETRNKSFAEVGRGYHKLKAIAESMRCLRCDRR